MEAVVAVASYLEPEHVERIRRAVPGARVLFDPDLLAPPRFQADHTGRPDFHRSEEQEARFRAALAAADVHYDVDRHLARELPVLAPRLRWIQLTSSGVGELLRRTGLDRTSITITNAAGIHAVPLAEHALLAMLYFVKDVPDRLDDMRARRWERYCGRELRGRTVGVIGFGAVGREVARVSKAMGLRVLGVRRNPVGDPAEHHADEVHPPSALHDVLPRCDVLVLALPHTPETEGMIGQRELATLPRGAILVNVGRGALLDEAALLAALRSGHLGGAALDVARVEPLPPESPLWAEPRVLITAHSASTVERENERLTDLFVDNLRRYVAGRPLRNVFPTPGTGPSTGASRR